ncbi:4500_t:CDS:2 [Funneliformis mosseae]|uniref:4500_t:CDS:1 n=1 Tax=Funneliformis mosseae TaxID=27381 RepID=A0A9N9GTZ5_FUNMO|nr:4500_t:CDS:2 [Funneliformis mosseae]
MSFNDLKKFLLPQLDIQTLANREFKAKNLKDISDEYVKGFLNDLNKVIKESVTTEDQIDTLVNNILGNIFEFHAYPLRIRLNITGEPYVTAIPDYLVDWEDINELVVEDKQLRNAALIPSKGYGEAQLAAELLACGSENMRELALRKSDVMSDQIIFGVRVISTYFTFYKAVISAKYFNELDLHLPLKESVVIQRWPENEHPKAGLNILKPDERLEALGAFAGIRKYIVNKWN